MPPDDDGPMHPDQHGGDLPPDDIPIVGQPDDPLGDANQPDYNTGPDPDDDDHDDDGDDGDDPEYIIPDIMDHHQMMTWTCQEYRTRGKHIIQVLHQHSFLILMFQLKKISWTR